MSDLVGNPEDRFSRVEAHMKDIKKRLPCLALSLSIIRQALGHPCVVLNFCNDIHNSCFSYEIDQLQQWFVKKYITVWRSVSSGKHVRVMYTPLNPTFI